MEIVYSPLKLVDPIQPNSGFLHITNAGFDNILLDFSIYCNCQDLENYGINENKKITLKKLPIDKWKIARTPYLAYDTKRMDINDILREMVKESIRYSALHHVKCVIVQPLFAGIDRKDLWNINKQYYLDLYNFIKEIVFRQKDVDSIPNLSLEQTSFYDDMPCILLQNLCKDVHGKMTRGICSDAVMAVQWIDELNTIVGENIFGICVDTGALNLCGQDMYEYIHTLGHRIMAVILRENDGYHNVSMLPFTSVAHGQSQMDWLGVIRGLREIEFDEYLIMEFGDTAHAFSPLLRPQFLQLAKSVADYFKWQIEIEKLLKKHSCIVLFGAGNMCRNYMKCYGKKYPPLFTCDNNKNLWGTEFEGLEVKSPEVLKNLPKDCSIFICNVYYNEIEKQLRDMGVENDIEFFNDEYMPTFYFDRIKR